MKPLMLLCAVLMLAMHLMPSPRDNTHVTGDPDTLFAQRDSVALARQAEAIWAQRLSGNATDFESAWKLARVRYWLGTHTAETERKKYLDAGIEAARAATSLAPARPEGHLWLAGNLIALGESFGLLPAFRYRGPLRDALTTLRQLDATFDQGAADRLLGRWYRKTPTALGGSTLKAEEHLRRSLQYAPEGTASLYLLAETLVDLGRVAEARVSLQGVIDAPFTSETIPEDREFKQRARRTLQDLTTCPRNCLCRSAHGPGAMCAYSWK